jgi:uncharacterized 2Fe-2S/4Fe-4S cluster protein (DUF4445 family)
MNQKPTIRLEPLGVELEVPRGTPLKEILFPYGVEFPCGGIGECSSCRIRLLTGRLPITEEQRVHFTDSELEDGWRLACTCSVDDDLVIELGRLETPVLADNTPFPFKPQDGFGIAVDLGTTTLAAQLVDLRTGNVIAVQTDLNPQAQFGADIMHRISFAISDKNEEILTSVIRTAIGSLIDRLLAETRGTVPGIRNIIIAGNTAMQHFFCGIEPHPLSGYPFQPEASSFELFSFPASILRWNISGNPAVRFLPSLGGFVGSDILAGILATNIHTSEAIQCLIDLGTNGEIVIGNRDKLLCASTAAGPAFEGARISQGMRATTGAIHRVRRIDGSFICEVVGTGEPRGICGSGLVDAVALGLDMGVLNSTGRFSENHNPWLIHHPVFITQQDIRELQLAKAAIATGIKILTETLGLTIDDITRVYLAGAFGNYITIEQGRRIGLFPFTHNRIKPAGNTSLLGSKILLFDENISETCKRVQKITEHIHLNNNPAFMDMFVNEMNFPEPSPDFSGTD